MTKPLLSALMFASLFYNCSPSHVDNRDQLKLKTYSNAEPLVDMFPDFSGVAVYPLISSSDTLAETPGFLYGGAPDGQGFLKNPDGSGYIMVTNHENSFSISRLYLNKQLKPVRGE